MNRAKQRQWMGRVSRSVGTALRLCAVLLLILQIVYTPIHLVRVPHSDVADFSAAAPMTSATAFAGDENQDGDGHHERHPAAQHKLKVTQLTRAIFVEMVQIPEIKWLDAENECPQPQAVDFSGLSPPELPRCWQFFFRAALPVRAPSLLS
jgi:hypothetical protein